MAGGAILRRCHTSRQGAGLPSASASPPARLGSQCRIVPASVHSVWTRRWREGSTPAGL